MNSSFWNGVLMALSVYSLFQDSMGLEAYIEFCRKHWIDLHPTVWIPFIVGLAFIESKTK